MFAGASHNSRLSAVAPVAGSTKMLARVAELIAGLVPDDVDLLKVLHRIQHEFTYIPSESIPLLAAQFDTTPALIYGTIDFYSELRQIAPAENVVEWCSGPACLLKGSSAQRRALEAVLGCAMGQQSADGKVELRLVQCDGTCHLAPLIRYKDRYIGPLTTSDAINFARSLNPQTGATPLERGKAEAPHPPAAEVAASTGVAPQEPDRDHRTPPGTALGDGR